MWAVISNEFTNKSQMAQARSHTECMNMRSCPRTNLHTKFDALRTAYDDCLSARVTISGDEYRALITNFCSELLSTFISQISANVTANTMFQHTATCTTGTVVTMTTFLLDPEDMITLILQRIRLP